MGREWTADEEDYVTYTLKNGVKLSEAYEGFTDKGFVRGLPAFIRKRTKLRRAFEEDGIFFTNVPSTKEALLIKKAVDKQIAENNKPHATFRGVLVDCYIITGSWLVSQGFSHYHSYRYIDAHLEELKQHNTALISRSPSFRNVSLNRASRSYNTMARRSTVAYAESKKLCN